MHIDHKAYAVTDMGFEGEPYYQVNDDKNGKLYQEYKKLGDAKDKVVFGLRYGLV